MGAPLPCKQEVWVRIPTFPIFLGHADDLRGWPEGRLYQVTRTKVARTKVARAMVAHTKADGVAAAQLSPKQ